MTARITEAGLPHAGIVSALHKACFDAPWDERAVADILAMPGAVGLLADFEAETPQGFILFRLAADEAEIISIGVLPGARRKGLAALLLGRAVGLAGTAGVTRLFLEVAEDNAAARAFYEKAGFTIVGRRKAYYERTGGRIDALVYRREITPK